MDIFERMRAGELILESDPDYPILQKAFEKGMQLVETLNGSYHTDAEIRDILSQLTGKPVDPSVRMFLPFYTVFGQFTSFGKNVFINSGCTFLDREVLRWKTMCLSGPRYVSSPKTTPKSHICGTMSTHALWS